MTEPPPFVYDPLPAGYIRLLTPTPSEAADGHTWKIQTVALDRPDLEFDALSYVWGSDSERLRITLNGCAMQVHRNLYIALPYLARRGDGGPVRPIWIDAICINQADREEKMVQIREMNRVYKQAKRVWVWLGITKHQDRIPDALRFLENLRDEKEGQQHRNIDELYGKLSFDTLDAKPALCHVVLNDWFGRLWVLQEAALAREVTFLCGDSKCSWELMENAMKDAVLCQIFDKEFDGVKNPLPLPDEPLVLTGKIHDEVVKVFAMMPFPDSSQHNIRSEQREKLLAIANWEQTIAAGMDDPTLTRPRAGIGSDRIHEEYWRALVDNQEPGRYLDQTIKHDWYLDFQTMGRRLRGVDLNPTALKAKSDHVDLESGTSINVSEQFLEAEDQCANAYKFMEAMQKVSFRQLFKTKKGHLSSTIPGVMPGDVLIAMNGAPILHVIRKVNAAVDGELEIWEFVGDAYVYPPDCGNDEESILEEEQVNGNHAEENTRADSNTDKADDEEREFVFV
ncbi:hypothetical protein J4E93_004735 [Alternaria ventricosa]|uniref:uncharacterized protein n=1 Tax=Alternaria ventricosa TaxID=1187951 RepID=UPI0020C534EA|nr:uncharacterized protein J4E93_004735 [Alternaria ventricosa]KAI4648323.1 hypothetical protein J4E93_004735 [Alternaria ventricosa]